MQQTMTSTAQWSGLVAGLDQPAPLLTGAFTRYVNLDNAASTPPLLAVRAVVDRMADCYSSVHRGSGYKSQLSTTLYERARELVLEFVRADPAEQVAIFVGNTTDALNHLAFRLGLTSRDVVLTSVVEHHSNLLPWRDVATVDYAAVDDEGRLDLGDLEARLAGHGGRVRLVAVTGASNVTGYIPPIHTIARLAHRYGAEILVDAAQLAAHRPIDVRRAGDPEHLDYMAISSHKLYAPYGSGALIAPRARLETGRPFLVGGGTVDIVTRDEAVFSGLPDREEAGSPNVIGAVALGKAIETLLDIGLDAIAEHERELTAYALRRLREVPDLELYGPADIDAGEDRGGVFTFNLAGVPHALVAAVLSHEFGIGVRKGCFCAHPYLLRLLKVDADEAGRAKADILRHDRTHIPGAVRASLGIYNTAEDIDRLVAALGHIARGEYRGAYHLETATGDYLPVGYEHSFADYSALLRGI